MSAPAPGSSVTKRERDGARQDARRRTQDTRHETQGTGHKAQGTRRRAQDTGHRVLRTFISLLLLLTDNAIIHIHLHTRHKARGKI